MDNTLLVNLSHQMAAYQSMDVIANNLANISTPGFKREQVRFEQYLMPASPVEDSTGNEPVSFVLNRGVVRDSSEGRIDQTGASYDFAIHGKGYFEIQTAAGMRFTRDGHFTLSGDGTMVDSQGNPVMGDGGAITISPDDGVAHIAQDGTITGNQGQLGKLKVVSFADDGAMQKDGANLYATDQTPEDAADSAIQQGMLEASNVQPVVEMSNMIEVMRAYQAVASLNKSQQDLLTKADQQLGTVQDS